MKHKELKTVRLSWDFVGACIEKEIKKYNIAEVDVLSIVPEKCDLGADKINI